MTLVKGSAPTAPTAGTARQAPLPFKAPMGSVKVYDVRRKTFKRKDGSEVDKTQIHYEKDGSRFAFASNREDFVNDMAELAKLMTKPDGKQTSITATFGWVKGGALTVTVA
jgi:hypothetical protein